MKIKQAFLLAAITLTGQSNYLVRANAEVDAAVGDDSAAEVKVQEAIEVANEEAVAKECTTEEDCVAPPAEEDVPPAVEEEEASPSSSSTKTTMKKEEDPSCPSRPHVIRCAAKYLDTNQNGALERSELETAMSSVPWILRSLLNIIGSIDSIMKKCDADADGSIDIENDMKATEETCLATCFKRKAFKKLFFADCTE